MLVFLLIKFCNRVCNGKVSATKSTGIITCSTLVGLLKRLFELTYPTMVSIESRQTKIREYLESTKRLVSSSIEIFTSTASTSTREIIQSRTRKSAKSNAFWKSLISSSFSSCGSTASSSTSSTRSSRLKVYAIAPPPALRPKRRKIPYDITVVKIAIGYSNR